MVTWEQRALEGDPKFEASQEIPDFPYARYAELLGLRGIRVDDPSELGAAWDEALSADRPVCSRRSSTPRCRRCRLTSRSSRRETSCSSVARGDEGWWSMIEQSFKAKLKEIVR